MPDAMIELDVSAPWEPPERPGPGAVRRQRAWRRVLVGLAALLAVLVVPAGAPSRQLEPLYTADFQVLALDAAGGRIIVHRYQPGGAGPLAVALDAGSGRVLWERAGRTDESYTALTDRVAFVQVEQTDLDGRFTGWMTAYDAATGAQLWQRPNVRFTGLAGGLVVVEEAAWPGEDDGFDASFGSPDDPGVSLPQLPHHVRLLGLDEVAGATRWTVESPPGTLPGLDIPEYPQIRGLTELDGHGVLRVRDLGSGAVSREYHLDFDGVVARHQPGRPGQEVVWPAGRGGPEVFDLASGRRLWRAMGDPPAYNGPVPCLRVRYCLFGDSGTDVLDAGTGAVVWRVDGYGALLQDTGDRLLMYRQVSDDYHPDDVTAFGADRDGAVAWHRQGWLIAGGSFRETYTPNAIDTPGYFVWRPISNTDAIIGRLDAGTGRVEVIGRAPDFYGSPQCTATADRVACLAIGTLYVWGLS